MMGVFRVRSLAFKKELQRRQKEFQGKALAVRLTAPPEMQWWYFQEHGTATRGEFGGSAYPIVPVNTQAIAWGGSGSGRVYRRIPAHPGIRARHMVAKVWDDVTLFVGQEIAKVIGGQSSYEQVRFALVNEIMPQVKDMIRQSFADNLPGTNANGKLGGETAAEVFDTLATIVEQSD